MQSDAFGSRFVLGVIRSGTFHRERGPVVVSGDFRRIICPPVRMLIQQEESSSLKLVQVCEIVQAGYLLLKRHNTIDISLVPRYTQHPGHAQFYEKKIPPGLRRLERTSSIRREPHVRSERFLRSARQSPGEVRDASLASRRSGVGHRGEPTVQLFSGVLLQDGGSVSRARYPRIGRSETWPEGWPQVDSGDPEVPSRGTREGSFGVDCGARRALARAEVCFRTSTYDREISQYSQKKTSTLITRSADVKSVAFLGVAGAPQQRYEKLRSCWLESESQTVFDVIRLSWGQRFFHFGILGLLDEDPTGCEWFGSSREMPFGSGKEFRCVRTLLATEDSEPRVHQAYRLILSAVPLKASGEEFQ